MPLSLVFIVRKPSLASLPIISVSLHIPTNGNLIRTLVDRTYKINSTWAGFHKDIKYLTQILKKNLFPTHLIERVINQYVIRVESEVCSVGCVPDKVSTFYFKLPYIGHYSGVTQKRIRHLIKRYCNNIVIKLIFSSFKIGNL